MQYLVNKTNGVFQGFLGARVGAIRLTPYEALPVNVERDWDAEAFNQVRMNPTRIGLFEKVPKDLATKRQVYLESKEQVSNDVAKESEINQEKQKLQSDILALEKALEEEKANIATAEHNVNKLKEQLDKETDSLTKDDKDITAEMQENLAKLEAEFLEASNSLELMKSEYSDVEKTLNELKGKLSNM